MILLLVPVMVLSACTRDTRDNGSRSDSTTRPAVIRIAEQHGLAYLPLAIMQVEALLEKELTDLPEVRVEWLRAGNATMIREAMLSGRLDIGFMGIPPFLIGLDRGTEWRIISGLSEAPLGLVTVRPGSRTLRDLGPRDRIALPQPGSIQHILLAMAAEREFGDARRFDDRLVSMGHPEGLAALLAGRDVTAHFTAPPFLFRALEEQNGALLLDGREAFGDRFTFIVGVTAPGWDENPDNAPLLRAFLRALDRAIVLTRSLTNDPPPGPLLEKLARFYDLNEDSLRAQMAYPGMVYTREVHGMEQFIERMDRYGYLDRDRVVQYRSSILE